MAAQLTSFQVNLHLLVNKVWCTFSSLPLLKYFEINNSSEFSEHWSCVLTLNVNFCSNDDNINTCDNSRDIFLNRDLSNLINFEKNLELCPGIYFDSESVYELFVNFKNSVSLSMISSNILVSRNKYSGPITVNKPWFNSECYNYKKQVSLALKFYQKSNFSLKYLVDSYLKHKKTYKLMVKNSKLDYINNMKSSLRETKNPTEF